MRIEERKDGANERKILIGMITNRTILAKIASKWRKQGMFSSKLANIVGAWCVRHYKKFERCPNKAVEAYFNSWTETNPPQEDVTLVEKFLSEISGQYQRLKKGLKPEFVIDLAGNHFESVAIKSLMEDIDTRLSVGELDEARKKIDNFRHIEFGADAHSDPTTDKSIAMQVFNQEQYKSIIQFSGGLGRFFGHTFRRGAFAAIVGPEKSGKTNFLTDIAFRGLCSRIKVAFFGVGDETEEDLQRRFLVRVSGIPDRSEEGWPLTVKLPTKIIKKQGYKSTLRCKETTFKKPLNGERAWKAARRFMKYDVRSKKSYLHISCHPNFTCTVNKIEDILRSWQYDDWIPDLVIVDYADLLASSVGDKWERRDQIDTTWMQLRAISQKFHCCVLTASQVRRAAYKKAVLTMEDIAEDKRKLAHVTDLFGINVSEKEKELQITRLNAIVRRHAKFSPFNCCHVAGCMSIGNPAIVSAY